jgi:hypothetical protein
MPEDVQPISPAPAPAPAPAPVLPIRDALACAAAWLSVPAGDHDFASWKARDTPSLPGFAAALREAMARHGILDHRPSRPEEVRALDFLICALGSGGTTPQPAAAHLPLVDRIAVAAATSVAIAGVEQAKRRARGRPVDPTRTGSLLALLRALDAYRQDLQALEVAEAAAAASTPAPEAGAPAAAP